MKPRAKPVVLSHRHRRPADKWSSAGPVDVPARTTRSRSTAEPPAAEVGGKGTAAARRNPHPKPRDEEPVVDETARSRSAPPDPIPETKATAGARRSANLKPEAEEPVVAEVPARATRSRPAPEVKRGGKGTAGVRRIEEPVVVDAPARTTRSRPAPAPPVVEMKNGGKGGNAQLNSRAEEPVLDDVPARAAGSRGPVAEVKGAVGVRRNVQLKSEAKSRDVKPVVRSLRNRVVGAGDDASSGVPEELSPRRGQKRGRTAVAKEAAEQGRHEKGQTRRSRPTEAEILMLDIAKKKDGSAVLAEILPAGVEKGNIAGVQGLSRRTTRSIVSSEVSAHVEVKVAKMNKRGSTTIAEVVSTEHKKEKSSAVNEPSRRSSRSSTIDEVSVPAEDERASKRRKVEGAIVTEMGRKLSVPEEPSRRTMHSSADNKISVADERVGKKKKKKADTLAVAEMVHSESQKESPRRPTRSSGHDEISVPASDAFIADEKVVQKKKRGRAALTKTSPSKGRNGKPSVPKEPARRTRRSADDQNVVEKNKPDSAALAETPHSRSLKRKRPVGKLLPRKSARISIGNVMGDGASLPESDIPAQDGKVVEEKKPGKRATNRVSRDGDAARKGKISKLEDSPRRSAQSSFSPVPKHESSRKQQRKFRSGRVTTSIHNPKAEATCKGEEVHVGKISKDVKPPRRSIVKRESQEKQTQKQQTARLLSRKSTPASEPANVIKIVEVEVSQMVEGGAPLNSDTSRDPADGVFVAEAPGVETESAEIADYDDLSQRVVSELQQPILPDNHENAEDGDLSERVVTELQPTKLPDNLENVEDGDLSERVVTELQPSILPDNVENVEEGDLSERGVSDGMQPSILPDKEDGDLSKRVVSDEMQPSILPDKEDGDLSDRVVSEMQQSILPDNEENVEDGDLLERVVAEMQQSTLPVSVENVEDGDLSERVVSDEMPPSILPSKEDDDLSERAMQQPSPPDNLENVEYGDLSEREMQQYVLSDHVENVEDGDVLGRETQQSILPDNVENVEDGEMSEMVVSEVWQSITPDNVENVEDADISEKVVSEMQQSALPANVENVEDRDILERVVSEMQQSALPANVENIEDRDLSERVVSEMQPVLPDNVEKGDDADVSERVDMHQSILPDNLENVDGADLSERDVPETQQCVLLANVQNVEDRDLSERVTSEMQSILPDTLENVEDGDLSERGVASEMQQSILPVNVENVEDLPERVVSENQSSILPDNVENVEDGDLSERVVVSEMQQSILPENVENIEDADLHERVVSENQPSILPDNVENVEDGDLSEKVVSEMRNVEDVEDGDLPERVLSENQLSILSDNVENVEDAQDGDLSENQPSILPDNVENVEDGDLYEREMQQSILPGNVENVDDGDFPERVVSENQLSILPGNVENVEDAQEGDLSEAVVSEMQQSILLDNLENVEHGALSESVVSEMQQSILHVNVVNVEDDDLPERVVSEYQQSILPDNVENVEDGDLSARVVVSEMQQSILPDNVENVEDGDLPERVVSENQLAMLPGHVENVEDGDLPERVVSENQPPMLPDNAENVEDGDLSERVVSENQPPMLPCNVENVEDADLPERVVSVNQSSIPPDNVENVEDAQDGDLSEMQQSILPDNVENVEDAQDSDLSEMHQSILLDISEVSPILGDKSNDPGSFNSEEKNLQIGLDALPASQFSEKHCSHLDATKVSAHEVVEGSSVVVGQDGVDADRSMEAASDNDLAVKSNIQCSSSEKEEVGSQTVSQVMCTETIGSPLITSSCVASVVTISREAHSEGHGTIYTEITTEINSCSSVQTSGNQERNVGLLVELGDDNLAGLPCSEVVRGSEVRTCSIAATTVLDAHSFDKSDMAKESIGHAVEVTFTPTERAMNVVLGIEGKVPESSLQNQQNSAPELCCDDQVPSAVSKISSENISNATLLVVGSSSAHEPNLLKEPVEDREPSSPGFFDEAREMKDALLEVVEHRSAENIVDDKDDNSVRHADCFEPTEQSDMLDVTENDTAFYIVNSPNGSGIEEVSELESSDYLNTSSAPDSMAGATSLGKHIAVNTLPLVMNDKCVNATETQVFIRQVVNAEPFESATDDGGNFTHILQYEDGGKSNEISTVGTSFSCGRAGDEGVTALEGPISLNSTIVKAMDGATSAGRLFDYDKGSPLCFSVDSKFDKYTETQVFSSNVVDVEPCEPTIHHDENITAVHAIGDGDKHNEETSTFGASFLWEPAEHVEATNGSPRCFDINSVAEDVVTEPHELTLNDEGNFIDVIHSQDGNRSHDYDISSVAEDVESEPYDSIIKGEGSLTDVIQAEGNNRSNDFNVSSVAEAVEADPYESTINTEGNFIDVLRCEGSNSRNEFDTSSVAEDVDAEPRQSTISAEGNFVDATWYAGSNRSNNFNTSSATEYVDAEPCQSTVNADGDVIDVIHHGGSSRSNTLDTTAAEDVDTEPRQTTDAEGNFVDVFRGEGSNRGSDFSVTNVAGDVDAEPFDSTTDDGGNVIDVNWDEGRDKSSEVNDTVDVLPYEGGDKVNEVAPAVGFSFSFCFGEHVVTNVTDPLPDEGGDKCDEVMIPSGSEHAANNFIDVFPYDGSDKCGDVSNEVTPTVISIASASFSCRPAEHGLHGDGNVSDALRYEDADKNEEGRSPVGGSFFCRPAGHCDGNVTDVLRYEDDDKNKEGTSIVGTSSSVRPAEDVEVSALESPRCFDSSTVSETTMGATPSVDIIFDEHTKTEVFSTEVADAADAEPSESAGHRDRSFVGVIQYEDNDKIAEFKDED